MRRLFVQLQDHEHDLVAWAPTGEQIADDYLRFMHDRVALHDGLLLMAEEDGQVVGFACVLRRVEREEPDDPESDHAYLAEISVSPERRGHGVGSALLDAAERAAAERGARTIRLVVVAANDGAQRVYSRRGYERSHVVMTKRLLRG